MGIKAISLDSRAVQDARKAGRDVFKEVANCQWSIVIASPERLNAPEFDPIVRSDVFQENLVMYAIDESHVIPGWSQSFRVDYGEISRLFLRIRPDVPILMMTATASRETEAYLVNLLRMRQGEPIIVRAPSQRSNLRYVWRTLTHGLSGNTFPDLAWAATGRYKAILYCQTIELGFRVASYLWRLRGPGDERFRNIRTYNSLTEELNDKTLEAFRDDPQTFTIVATMKFGMGVDPRVVHVSGNVGLPESAEDIVQQNARAGRDPNIVAVGLTLVESTHVGAAVAGKGNARKSKGKKTEEEAESEKWSGSLKDPYTRKMVTAHAKGNCMVVEVNGAFGRAEEGSNELQDCVTAGRRLPCSSCITRSHAQLLSQLSLFDSRPSTHLQMHEPDAADTHTTAHPGAQEKSTTPTSLQDGPKRPQLTAAMRKIAETALDDLAGDIVVRKKSARFRFLPHTSFFPPQLYVHILDVFHLIRTREQLEELLSEWDHREDVIDSLFALIKKYNQTFDKMHEEARQEKSAKAAATRMKKKIAIGTQYIFSLVQINANASRCSLCGLVVPGHSTTAQQQSVRSGNIVRTSLTV